MSLGHWETCPTCNGSGVVRPAPMPSFDNAVPVITWPSSKPTGTGRRWVMENFDMEDDALREILDSTAKRQHNAIEAACEAMLVDPRGWGVLVHTGGIEQTGEYGFRIQQSVELSPLVPFGEIHDHQVAAGRPCEACETAATGQGAEA